MNTLTFIFPMTEEILSSSLGDLVSIIAGTSAIASRCGARFMAKRPGANGLTVLPALNDR